MTTQKHTVEAAVEAAGKLAPSVARRAAEVESARRLPRACGASMSACAGDHAAHGSAVEDAPRPSLARRVAVMPIRAYQVAISPMLGQRCKYHPSCSAYAVQAIEELGVARGIVLGAWRLLRCNPWSKGGVDYPSQQRVFRR